MCDPNLLQSTKTILKYLINNGPREQTVDSLYFEFYKYVNTHIPLFELGYSYLVTFLQSIPDILEVDPVTLEIRPSMYASPPRCNRFMEKPPTTFPRVLPWTQTYRKSNEYEQRAPKALTIKRLKSPNESFSPPLGPLGPRSIGDGKCSSSDSIMIDNEMEPDDKSKYFTVETVMHPNEPKNDLYFCPDKSIIQFDRTLSPKTELNKVDTFDFKEEAEPDLSEASVLQKPRYCNSSFDGDAESDEQTPYKQDQSLTTASLETSVTLSKHSYETKNDFCFDPHVSIIQKISDFDENMIQFDNAPSAATQLNTDDKPEFDGKPDLDLNAISVLRNPLPSSSLRIIGKPSHDFVSSPYLKKNKKLVEPTYDYDSDYYISSPEEQAFEPSDNCAIPFLFSELDDKINMLGSCFFNGNYGCKYETSKIGELMTVGSVYELYVSEVNNPYKFWFQLDEEIPNPVEELQERLNECYNMTDCIPEIKMEHMKKGYACAALYCQMWHRGEMLGHVKDGKVSIYFVDYGTVHNVRIDEVRYLMNSFCSLPKLCHRGTLDYVKPINDHWTVDTTTFFIALVENRKLTAGVTEIDLKNNSVRLYLIDTKTNTNINYTLVCEGFAYPDDPRNRYQRHIADVVPSFDRLEKGQHATFSEVATLLEQNYDYDKLMHRSVIDDFDFYIPSHVQEDEMVERMQSFRKKKEEEQKLAEQRDATLFLEIFGGILENPFFNGTATDESVVNDPNPFLD